MRVVGGMLPGSDLGFDSRVSCGALPRTPWGRSPTNLINCGHCRRLDTRAPNDSQCHLCELVFEVCRLVGVLREIDMKALGVFCKGWEENLCSYVVVLSVSHPYLSPTS